MIQSFKGMVPVVDPTAYVHPLATIIGHVTLGANVYVGPGAVLRGDWGKIEVSEGCNVQENCVLHMFPGQSVLLDAGAHIGHGAIVHGAHIGAQCLVGMNAVIMDDVILGKESIVGALAFLPAESLWEPRSLIVGNPAKCIKTVSDAMLGHKREGTELYAQLPAAIRAHSQEVEPLTAVPENRPENFPIFETWKARQARWDAH